MITVLPRILSYINPLVFLKESMTHTHIQGHTTARTCVLSTIPPYCTLYSWQSSYLYLYLYSYLYSYSYLLVVGGYFRSYDDRPTRHVTSRVDGVELERAPFGFRWSMMRRVSPGAKCTVSGSTFVPTVHPAPFSVTRGPGPAFVRRYEHVGDDQLHHSCRCGGSSILRVRSRTIEDRGTEACRAARSGPTRPWYMEAQSHKIRR